MTPYSDLYGMLQEVRRRPSMWVHDKSLADLETMLHGYSNALLVHGIQEYGTGFNARFRGYLARRFGWSISLGWAWAITANCRDTNEAFDRFFGLVDEFRAGDGLPACGPATESGGSGEL
jgi:hypothetical protein